MPKPVTVTIVDVCLKTKINIVPNKIENFVTFAGYNITSVNNYTFNDSKSHIGTTTSDSEDYCGGKILAFYINDTVSNLLAAKNKE